MAVPPKRSVAASVAAACAVLTVTLVGATPSLASSRPRLGALAPAFASSTVSTPASGSELFYDAGLGVGTVSVQGTVSPAVTSTGTLVCYSAPQTYMLAAGVSITAGAFSTTVPLTAVAGQVCRLELVPSGAQPGSAASGAFAGPVISVSMQMPLQSNGQSFGYYVLAGDPSWSFAFGGDALGTCPIAASDATDPINYGSYSLFFGDACLPAISGLPPQLGTRSAIEVGGANAYVPGSIPLLSAKAGFMPMSFGTAWDANHDTVTVSETDALMVCASPGGYPPVAANCPSLASAGVQLQQTATLESGDQVARVTQTFNDTDGTAHTLDLLVSQAVHAYASGGEPGFEFPSQASFATHGSPDAYSSFPTGPGTVYVLANANQPPSGSNPVGAITYNAAPASAAFVNPPAAQTGTFLMHYVEALPAGGSVTLQWSFSQAASAAALGPIVQLETDRFYTPAITIATPVQGSLNHTASVLVSGHAYDPEGISAITVDGQSVGVGAGDSFSSSVPLHLGANTVQVTATNIAGVTADDQRTVSYEPVPCIVPKLTGRTLSRARKMLIARGCAAGKVRRVHSKRVRRGHVVSTTPRAGTHRTHGAAVRITLSAGAPRAKRRSRHRR